MDDSYGEKAIYFRKFSMMGKWMESPKTNDPLFVLPIPGDLEWQRALHRNNDIKVYAGGNRGLIRPIIGVIPGHESSDLRIQAIHGGNHGRFDVFPRFPHFCANLRIHGNQDHQDQK